MKFDANRDRDVNDVEDYVLYNEIYVIDAARDAEVRLVYSLSPHMTNGTFGDFKGEFLWIGGKRFLVTDAEDHKVDLGEPIEKIIYKRSSAAPDTARRFVGDVKMGIWGDVNSPTNLGILVIVNNQSIEGTVDLDYDNGGMPFVNKSDISSAVHEVSDSLDDYLIFLTNAKPGATTIAIIKEDQLFDLYDGQEDVLGYVWVKIDDAEFAGGAGANKIIFLGDLYTVPRGKSIGIPDSLYEMGFYYNKTVDIVQLQTGSISISSLPPRAEVYLNGSYERETPATIRVLTGSYTVVLRKEGYGDWSQTVAVTAGTTKVIKTNLTLKPLKPGSISVFSSPTGARLYIDRSYIGMAPITVYGLSNGPHTIILKKERYDDWSANITVLSGTMTTLSVNLTAKQGSVSVSSSPAGANVYLDRAYIGTTPLTIPGVSAGSHTVTLKKEGYEDRSVGMVVEAGSTVELSPVLTSSVKPTAIEEASPPSTSTANNTVMISESFKEIPKMTYLYGGVGLIVLLLTMYWKQRTN